MKHEYTFPSAILNSRKQKGLTQEQVAEKLGISKRWYQMIEKGKKLPSPSLMIKIIAVLEIDGKMLMLK